MHIERYVMATGHNCEGVYGMMKISKRRQQNARVVLRVKLDRRKDERCHDYWL